MLAAALLAIAGLSSAWMLLWASAALIPLVLHLLYRHRQQTVPWAAIELLRKVIEQQSRRIRFEQLLLLVLRMLACLLLGLALARPFFATPTGARTAELVSPPRLWVLVIDGSYSMGYREQDSTRWDAARERATQIVRNASLGDGFAVVRLGKPSQAIVSQVSFDRDAVASQIAQMRLADGGADLASCLAIIQEIMHEAQRDERNPKSIQVVFLSDLGQDTWQSALEGPTQRSLRQLAAASRLSIEPLSADIPANLAITSLTAAHQSMLVDRRLSVTATVENFSSAAIARLPLQIQLDDQTVYTEFVDLASGESKSVTTEVLFTRPGSTVVSALIPSDRLVVDNRRDLVVLVRQQYQVLCVEDRTDAARLVAIALAPDDTPSAPIRVATISGLEFSAQDLSIWDAIVVCNVTGPSPIDARRLFEFASSGKGVICLLAGEALAEQWNVATHSGGLDLLGFQLSEPSADREWRLDPLDYKSPVTQPFADFPDSGLLTTPIFRYWRSDPGRSTSLVVDVAMENSDPLIVRHRVGRGWVASFLSAPMSGNVDPAGARPWNAIGSWPSFVPLIRQLLQAVVGGQADAQNLTVGQSISGSAEVGGTTSQPRMMQPDGTESALTLGEPSQDSSSHWSFGPTERRGIYTLAFDSAATQQFAVNIDSVESSLEAMPLTSLPQSLPETRETVLPTPINGGAPPQEEFPAKVVLCLLAAALLAESILAWSMGRRLA